ncbi:MAG: hypothetical protein ACRDGL_10970, partial [Candidatus Limnocylindrales bacterium]
MRLYAPAPTEAVLERLLADDRFRSAVMADRLLPARPAVLAPFPAWLAPPIAEGLRASGIDSLYCHQAEA